MINKKQYGIGRPAQQNNQDPEEEKVQKPPEVKTQYLKCGSIDQMRMAIQSDDSDEYKQSDSDSDEIVVKKKTKPSNAQTVITKHESLKPKTADSHTIVEPRPPEQSSQKPQLPQPKKRRFVNDSDDDDDSD